MNAPRLGTLKYNEFSVFPPKAFDKELLPIIALDPGETTGWSLIVLPRKIAGIVTIWEEPFPNILERATLWVHGQVSCMPDEEFGSYMLMRLISEWPSAAVISESFILRSPRREKTASLLSPVRIQAKIDHHMWRQGRKLWQQQPAFAKSTCTDARLKLWGCYVKEGQLVHARDADRHAILFIRRCLNNEVNPLEAWPLVYKDGNVKAEA